jgi:hypothetical protein
MIICAVTLGLLKRSETKSLFWLRGSDKRKFRIECDSVGDATETRSDDMDDGETFADGEWIDKSGNGNNSLYTQNIELSHQKGLQWMQVMLSSF